MDPFERPFWKGEAKVENNRPSRKRNVGGTFSRNAMNTIHTLMLSLMLAASPFTEFPGLVGQGKEKLSVSINDLRNAPTEVVLDGRSLSLSADLWRDFMPTVSDIPLPPDGKPMIANFKVATSDKKLFPSGVRMDRAWVLFDEQMWEVSDLRGRVKGEPSYEDAGEHWINCPESPVCIAVARDGPKWGPGVYVDVVVRLTDNRGRHYLLQAPKQYINRTD